jgi:PelA/Pel-15E family pectate lyase
MVEVVSTNGGYLWNYLPDLSRRWGEMEAYKTMIWIQHPGTVSMGHLFLDAYKITGDEYYYQAAQKAAAALIWGQHHEGGWNYMIDFAGDKSLKSWYNTIGKNGWRLEEFHHYYGNATFDDDVTSDAARFLLRMYLEKLDPAYKPPLDKAIDFILKSQYPLGGWPQRYPLRYDFVKNGKPDYTSFYTFNDDVIWENIHFLIQCYLTLGEERFLDPIRRGMYFYLISQDQSGGWGQQLNMELQTVGARTYEPAALLPGTTRGNAMLLLRFYQYTGDRKFLDRVPAAIRWLEETRLPEDKTEGGRFTHPTFVELGTNRPIYVHRKGSNVKYGYYYYDYNAENLLSHYYGKRRVDIGSLKKEYERLAKLPVEEVTKDSPFNEQPFLGEGTPQKDYELHSGRFTSPDESQVRGIIKALDSQNRWLVRNAMTSNPYVGDGKRQDLTDEFASTNVGDETDTSPYRDQTDQEYLTTSEFIRNMYLLMSYIRGR